MKRLRLTGFLSFPFVLLLSMLLGMVLVASCESDKPPIAPAIHKRDSIPVMTSYGVSKLISDSGVIRYKIVAEEWKVYDRTNPPRQTFEKGLLLEKFNQTFHVQMYITADTAYWYNQSLWELRGRVCVWNEDGMIFHSELLYWDMNKHEFYSNKYSHLITPDKEIKGHSFHSNEQMTQYEVNITQASFPLQDIQGSTATPSDTTNQAVKPDVHSFQPKRATEKPDPNLPKGHFK